MKQLDWRSALAVLLLAIAGGFFAQLVIDDGGGKTKTIRIEVGKPTTPVQVPPLTMATPEVNLQDATPPGITPEMADDAIVTPPGLVAPQPPAGAQNYRCDNRPVVNQSDRAPGTKVSMFVLHIAVAPPGALNGIHNLFNTGSSKVSSNLGLEPLTGECEQWVPFSKKPWTQGAFNSVSESVEIITYLMTRKQWLDTKIIKDGILASIVRDRLRARGLPFKLVDPVGCTPKAGVTDHNRLECGNNHVDVGSGFPWDVFMKQLKASEVVADKTVKARRSHRILHAKIRKGCHGERNSASKTACSTWRAQNRALHKKYGNALK